MMTIHQSTKAYASWLAQELAGAGGVDQPALDIKYDRMGNPGDPFTFLRATYYRWAQLWEAEGEPGSSVASVGDLHVENFGTWRAASGALACGINDFDEACEAPWCSDLVRLAVSAVLGLAAHPDLEIPEADTLQAILAGYSQGISPESTPVATALPALLQRLWKRKSPKKYWRDEDEKLVELDEAGPDKEWIASAQAALGASLPTDRSDDVQYWVRDPEKPKGTGSLGRRRLFARTKTGEIQVMAEAKAFVHSAMEIWRPGHAGPGLASAISRMGALVDPTNKVEGDWVLRLSTSNTVKVELGDLPKVTPTAAELAELFQWMGASLAAVHATSKNAPAVRTELAGKQNTVKWLSQSVHQWTQKIEEDLAAFRPTPTV